MDVPMMSYYVAAGRVGKISQRASQVREVTPVLLDEHERRWARGRSSFRWSGILSKSVNGRICMMFLYQVDLLDGRRNCCTSTNA